MQRIETQPRQTSSEPLLFTTFRRSRTADVSTTEQALLQRYRREEAWAKSIGMDTTNIAGWTLTGSTGTRPPIHIEEGILDDYI